MIVPWHVCREARGVIVPIVTRDWWCPSRTAAAKGQFTSKRPARNVRGTCAVRHVPAADFTICAVPRAPAVARHVTCVARAGCQVAVSDERSGRHGVMHGFPAGTGLAAARTQKRGARARCIHARIQHPVPVHSNTAPTAYTPRRRLGRRSYPRWMTPWMTPVRFSTEKQTCGNSGLLLSITPIISARSGTHKSMFGVKTCTEHEGWSNQNSVKRAPKNKLHVRFRARKRTRGTSGAPALQPAAGTR